MNEWQLAQINETVKSNLATMIVAQTGSGKTTSIPPRIHSKGVKIIVSVPTRIAAERHADYVREHNPSLKVDYAIRGVYVKELPDILYATTGTVINYFYDKIVNGKYRGSVYNVYLMIDEVHVQSVENTILLALWLHIYQSGGREPLASVPKLILVTATKVPLNLPNVEVAYKNYTTESTVGTVFLDGYPNFKEYLKLDLISRIVKKIKEVKVSHKGNILVFVPGKSQSIKIFQKLNMENVIAVSRNMDPKDKDKLLSSREDMVLIATNVVESSVTINNVSVVIDSMKENRPSTGSTSMSKGLKEDYISLNSSIQRKGRAGRTKGVEGFYYPMMTHVEYEKLKTSRDMDINIVPIHHVILTIISYNINPKNMLERVKVNPNKIISTIKDLLNLELVQGSIDRPMLTDVGFQVSHIQLDIRPSLFLVKWINSDYDPYSGVVIACLINGDISKLFVKGETEFLGSDQLHTLMRFWKNLVILFPNILKTNFKTSKPISKWCEDNHVSYIALRNIIDDIKMVSKSVTNFYKKEFTVSDFNIVDVMEKAISIFNVSHSLWVMSKEGDKYVGISIGNNFTYKISNNIPYKDRYSNDMIIALSQMDTSHYLRMVSLFVYSTFIYSRYANYENTTIDYEYIPEPEIIKIFHNTFNSNISNLNNEYSFERIPNVTVESIGYNRSMFDIPDVLQLTIKETDSAVIRTMSLCLIPEFIRVPTVKVKTGTKTLIKEEEDLSEIDRSYLDEIFGEERTVNPVNSYVAEPENMVYNYRDLGTTKLKHDEYNEIPEEAIDPLISFRIHW